MQESTDQVIKRGRSRRSGRKSPQWGSRAHKWGQEAEAKYRPLVYNFNFPPLTFHAATVGGVTQWLGRRSVAGGLSLIYA